MEGTHPVFRWIFSIGFFGVAGSLLQRGYQQLDPTQLGFGLLFFFVGVAVIFTKLLELACRPLIMVIDAIFFPGGKLSKPVKNLKLPLYYEKENRWEEALAEYRKIIRYYPDEALAYEGAIRILMEELGDFPQAEALYAKSQRRNLPLSGQVAHLFPASRRKSPL